MYMITACSANGLVYPWCVCKVGSNATCLLSYVAAELNMHKYFVKPNGGHAISLSSALNTPLFLFFFSVTCIIPHPQ